jgi:hypothetical protein
VLDVTAISLASISFPRAAITTAPPCSAAFPTIATMIAETKNCESPTLCANASIECTRISETNAVAAVATASTAIATGMLHDSLEASWPDALCASRWRRSEAQRSPA